MKEKLPNLEDSPFLTGLRRGKAMKEKLKRCKEVRMIFEVIVPFHILCDEESFKEDFKGSLNKLCKYLYKEEGIFWHQKMKFIAASFTKDTQTEREE